MNKPKLLRVHSSAENISPPVLPPAPRGELIAMAVHWYNSTETWCADSGRWMSTSAPDAVLFPIVIDFIRDRLHHYRNRSRPSGLSIDQATAAVERKVLDAIAEQFPWLAAECKRESQERRDEEVLSYPHSNSRQAQDVQEGHKPMNAKVNVPRILQAMKKNGWGVAATCVNVGVNNKTLAKILNGQIPHRLDAFYRVIDGLKIPIEEAVINDGAPKTAQLLGKKPRP